MVRTTYNPLENSGGCSNKLVPVDFVAKQYVLCQLIIIELVLLFKRHIAMLMLNLNEMG
jgi:hypothetical protein